MPPSELDLSELDALMADATPGPWEAREHEGLAAIAGKGGWVLDGDAVPAGNDARAIVALRNAWPALRERLAAAEAERAELLGWRRRVPPCEVSCEQDVDR